MNQKMLEALVGKLSLTEARCYLTLKACAYGDGTVRFHRERLQPEFAHQEYYTLRDIDNLLSYGLLERTEEGEHMYRVVMGE